MKKPILWTPFLLGALFVLWGIAVLVYPDGISGVITKAASDTRQVGIAPRLYADDHQGRLPQSLDQLVPGYLFDRTLLPHTYLATPSATLDELPPESIILFRVAADERRHETRILAVHPDMNVESKRP